MIREGKFGPAEAIVLLALSSLSRNFLSYPRLLVEIAGPAAWMTPFGGLVLVLVGIYLISLVLKKNPGHTIIETTEQAFGPFIGTAVNVLIVVSAFEMLGALFLREFSESMLTTTLRFAPISVIDFSFLAMGLLGAYLGIEALARTARLIYLYVLAGLFITFFSLIPFWNFYNLLPLFGKGLARDFLLGTYATAGISEVILAAVIVQAMGGVTYFTRIGYSSMLISFGILIMLLATLVLTYNWPVSEEFTLPFLRLSRTIYLGRFFQRPEAIFILIWTIIGALKISLMLYGAAVSLARSLKLPDYRPLIWPLGLAMFIIGLLPLDMPTTVNLDNIMRRVILIPNYLLPLLILAVYWLKGRRGRAGS